MAGFEIIGMIFDVAFRLATFFKQHLAANGMKSKPLFVVTWRSQLVFALDHTKESSRLVSYIVHSGVYMGRLLIGCIASSMAVRSKEVK